MFERFTYLFKFWTILKLGQDNIKDVDNLNLYKYNALKDFSGNKNTEEITWQVIKLDWVAWMNAEIPSTNSNTMNVRISKTANYVLANPFNCLVWGDPQTFEQIMWFKIFRS